VTAYVEQRYGAWWVRGGLRRLADALLARCHERGVTVHLGSDVVEVTTDARGVTGVRLADGTAVPADVVVSDADAGVVYGTLLRRATRRTRLRTAGVRTALGRASASVSGFVLLLALDGDRGPGPPGAAHRVFFPADYDAEFDALFGRRSSGRLRSGRPEPVPDPTVYVHAPGDPALSPAGCESWFVLVNAPPHDPSPGSARGVDWDAPGLRERYADRVLDVLARRGVDVRDRIRWREVRTPADLERATASPGGAIYGTASHGARAALLRPANRSPVRGLYLVGGSAHPGGGLPIVALSAAIVADLVGPA
jgi:phytoene dehydrogenase-like protein